MSLDKDFEDGKPSYDFNECYQNYYKVIFKHIAYLIGNVQTAEDLTHEAFMKLYNSPPDHGNTAAWLSRVATNLAYNYLRGEKTKKAKESIVSEDDSSNVIFIEDIAIKNQEIRLTRKILNSMPARDRLSLLLKFSGYKYNEIAEIIGIEKTSVGTILARAQAKFKEKYSREVQS